MMCQACPGSATESRPESVHRPLLWCRGRMPTSKTSLSREAALCHASITSGQASCSIRDLYISGKMRQDAAPVGQNRANVISFVTVVVIIITTGVAVRVPRSPVGHDRASKQPLVSPQLQPSQTFP